MIHDAARNSEIVTVKAFDETKGLHICIDSDNHERFIDLLVSGDMHGYKPEWFIGRRVRFAWTQAYTELAHGVEILGEKR